VNKRKSGSVLLVVVVTALVVTPLVLFGVYLGYYVGDSVGYSKPFFAIAFSTAGFLVAIAILSKAIVKLLAKPETRD